MGALTKGVQAGSQSRRTTSPTDRAVGLHSISPQTVGWQGNLLEATAFAGGVLTEGIHVSSELLALRCRHHGILKHCMV